MFNGFPKNLSEEVKVVQNIVLPQNIKISENMCSFRLINGEEISFPYRIYHSDNYENVLTKFSFTQKMIYHALLTRSSNGFVREKHLRAILLENFPHWIIPYIVKLSDEYVIEILEVIFAMLTKERKDEFQEFCSLNKHNFYKSHDRMISYYNEYYKDKYNIANYVGEKLYCEYFGFMK